MDQPGHIGQTSCCPDISPNGVYFPYKVFVPKESKEKAGAFAPASPIYLVDPHNCVGPVQPLVYLALGVFHLQEARVPLG